MVGIGGLIKCWCMTCLAFGGRSFKPVCMALKTVDTGVCACQRKSCGAVVKAPVCFSIWMAGQTCCAIVYIAIDTRVLIICFRVGMTGNTGKQGVITRGGVTCCTLIPLSVVSPAINREVLVIVIKGGGDPSSFCMT